MLFLTFVEYGLKNYQFIYIGIILLVVTCIAQVRIEIRNSKLNTENPKTIIIKSRKETTKEYVFAVIPYILVLASADMQFEKIISLFTIFFIIGILYVRTNMVLTNPMFLLIGFRIFEITYEEKHRAGYEKTTLLLTRKSPWNGTEMVIEEIYDGINIKTKD